MKITKTLRKSMKTNENHQKPLETCAKTIKINENHQKPFQNLQKNNENQ